MRIRPGTLRAVWRKAQKYAPGVIPDLPGDIRYEWGEGIAKADSHLLHNALAVGRWSHHLQAVEPSFLEELHARGYDLTTIKFSVQKKTSA